MAWTDKDIGQCLGLLWAIFWVAFVILAIGVVTVIFVAGSMSRGA